METSMKPRGIKYKWIPLMCVIGYLLFTLFLYEFGPFAWKTHCPVLFYIYQILYMLSLFVGYVAGIYSANNSIQWTEEKDVFLIKMMRPLLTISAVILLITTFRDYGYSSFDFSGLVNDIVNGLSDMGASYGRRGEQITLGGHQKLGGHAFTIIEFFWSFAGFNVVLLGLLYYKKMRVPNKILVIINCFEITVYFMSVGTNIGVFRVVLAIAVFFVLSRISKRGEKERKKKASKAKVFLIIASAIVGFFVYFITTMKSRGGILYWNESSFNIGGIGLDLNSVMFKILPESLYMLLISVSGYLTQGLYAFSLSLEVPWTPMFGLGGSMQIVDLVSEHIRDITEYTFQYKIQEKFGWNRQVQWASAYTWFANDVSTLGVVLIMFLLGYFFAKTYKGSITSTNPFAKVVFYYLVVICIFLPCNNQIIQTSYTLFGFIAACVCFCFSYIVRLKIGK